jgi:hypothetical protein
MSTWKIILFGAAATSSVAMVAASAGAQDNTVDPADVRQCFVTIDRSGEMNSYNVVRQEFTDGSCTCFVTTGSDSQNASLEGQIASLLRERTCANDPFVNMPTENPALAGGGGASTVILAGTVGALGVLALATGSDSPVSP